MQTTGKVISEARAAKELTQRALADAIGVTASHVSDMEGDRRSPSPEVMAKLADVLSIDVEYLSYLTGKFPESAIAANYSLDEFRIRWKAFIRRSK